MKLAVSLLAIGMLSGCVKKRSEVQSVENPRQGSVYLESSNRTRVELNWELNKVDGINVAKVNRISVSVPGSLDNIEGALTLHQLQMLPKNIQIISTCEGAYPITRNFNSFKNTLSGVEVVFPYEAIFPVSDRREKDCSQELTVQIGQGSYLHNPIEEEMSKNIFKLNLNKIRGLVLYHLVQCQNEELILGVGGGYFAADISNSKAVEHLAGVTRQNKYPLSDGNIAVAKFENLNLLSTSFLSRSDDNGFIASSAKATPLDGGSRYKIEFKNIDTYGKVLSEGRNWTFNECHTY